MPKVEKNQINLTKCFCLKCPSYNDCAKGKAERLYCSLAIGKSACEYKMNGCFCSGCPVHRENDLKSGYYCQLESAE